MSTKPSDLAETRLSGETVYRGRLLHVKCDQVRLPNGASAGREYIDHPGAVTVIALLDDNRLVLERQFRYPLGRELIELPAGKIDPGEDPLATARRELREETGYVAEDWSHLTTIHPLCAYSNERIEMYLARNLKLEARALDEEEFLEVFTVPARDALHWVRSGRVTDVKTIIGLFLAGKNSRRRLAGVIRPCCWHSWNLKRAFQSESKRLVRLGGGFTRNLDAAKHEKTARRGFSHASASIIKSTP